MRVSRCQKGMRGVPRQSRGQNKMISPDSSPGRLRPMLASNDLRKGTRRLGQEVERFFRTRSGYESEENEVFEVRRHAR